MKILSLRVKLASGLLLIGCCITLITSAAHFYTDYQNNLKDIQTDLKIVNDGALPILQAAMWALDKEQVQLTLSGIISLPKIQKAELYSGNQLYSARGEISPDGEFISRTFPLHYDTDKTHALGELVVYTSMEPIYDGLFRHAGIVVSSKALHTFLLAIFIAWFFDHLVTRHVRRAARYVDHPIESRQSPLVLHRRQYKRDELDELTDAVNGFYERLHQRHQEIAEEKARYHALVENNPQAIWRCEMQSPISLDQNSHQIVAAIQINGVLAELNQAACQLVRRAEEESVLGDEWTRLPFIQTEIWQQLVNNQFQLKDCVSHFIDNEGQPHYFSNSLTCIIVDNHLHTIWGIAIDVTQRVIAQQALEQRERDLSASQARLTEAQVLANMGHWVYLADADNLQVSEEFARIYGFDYDGDIISWASLIKRIHPDDCSMVIQLLSDYRTEVVTAEHRIIWPTGEERHVQAMARKTINGDTVTTSFGIIMDITDRRRAEEGERHSRQALIESEARMAEAQEIAHMGHWILDNSSQQFTCSDEFYRLHGYEPQEFPACAQRFLENIHPSDRMRIEHAFSRVVAHAYCEDYRILRNDGELRFMRATITPFYSSEHTLERVFGISIDITEQRLAEMKWRDSQELFSKAFEGSPDGIVFMDSDSHLFIEVNRTFVEITGYDESALIGQTVHLFDHDDKSLTFSYVLTLSEQANNVEISLQKNDGSKMICLLSWRSVDLHGRSCTLAMLRDITTLRALEHKAEQQQKQLLRADQLAAIGTMVAGVAHEINNPNHLIQMNAELLSNFTTHLIERIENGHKSSTVNRSLNGISLEEILTTTPELLEDIKSSSRRIDRIVKDLKDFSRPRDCGEFTAINLNHIIQHACNRRSDVVAKNRIKILFELEQQLPKTLGDAQQLEQVIVNLVINAIDASSSDDSITIKTFTQDNQVICEVIDQGCGISADNIKYIFDPFFTTKQNRGGTGLGLAISFRLIREHKGELEVQSQLNEGTTMRIILPALLDDHTD